MSHQEKSAYFNELKAAGVKFDRHYREYTTEELKAAALKLRETTGIHPPAPEPKPKRPEAEYGGLKPKPPESEYGGLNAYNSDDEEPLYTDEQGRIWYREEVQKPATPRPRARRVLSYVDPGTKVEKISSGSYVETIEVAGDERRTAEVKITLPSYQVGIYKDPRFPFKIHVYNDRRGFDLFDVQKFYGGADLVPESVLRMYVENDLCYDITSTIRTIQQEYRSLQLQKGMKQ